MGRQPMRRVQDPHDRWGHTVHSALVEVVQLLLHAV